QVADAGGGAALVAAHEVEGRFQFQFLFDEGIGEIFHQRLQLAGVFFEAVGKLVDDGLGDLLDVVDGRWNRESYIYGLGFQLNPTPDGRLRDVSAKLWNHSTESEGICPWLKRQRVKMSNRS